MGSPTLTPYLLGDSGADTFARKDPGGHAIAAETAAELADWINKRS
ncbi:hypothetical protein ACW4FP_18150 [Paenarthrobacter ureafaciens]|jgi:phospholipase/carboxylesterase